MITDRVPDRDLYPPEPDPEWEDALKEAQREAVKCLIDEIEMTWDEDDANYTVEHIAEILDNYKDEYKI